MSLGYPFLRKKDEVMLKRTLIFHFIARILRNLLNDDQTSRHRKDTCHDF